MKINVRKHLRKLVHPKKDAYGFVHTKTSVKKHKRLVRTMIKDESDGVKTYGKLADEGLPRAKEFQKDEEKHLNFWKESGTEELMKLGGQKQVVNYKVGDFVKYVGPIQSLYGKKVYRVESMKTRDDGVILTMVIDNESSKYGPTNRGLDYKKLTDDKILVDYDKRESAIKKDRKMIKRSHQKKSRNRSPTLLEYASGFRGSVLNYEFERLLVYMKKHGRTTPKSDIHNFVDSWSDKYKDDSSYLMSSRLMEKALYDILVGRGYWDNKNRIWLK